MANKTPPITAVGIFTVLAPFSITTVTYSVGSVSTINSLVEAGTNVFNTVYSPVGLVEADYLTDISNGITIVTLISDSGPDITIPSSYIDTYPSLTAVKYSATIISIDVGDLPDTLTLAALLAEVKGTTENHTGITATVKLHKLPAPAISYAEHLVIDAAREAAKVSILSAWRERDNAEIELAKATLKITQLEALIVAAGV